MKNRIGFVLSSITVISVHILLLSHYEIAREETITVLPQKNITSTISLQRAVVKQPIVKK